MFRRADQLLIEQMQDKFPLHVLEYYWEGFEPSLTCFNVASGEVLDFDLEDVRFLVSEKRTCVGYFDGDKYTKCPKDAPVTTFGQCPECSKESFIPFQECVFDPKCDGEICNLPFCKRDHVLYLAFYDTRAKIGMSSSRRVERRLIEQGADAFAIIGSFGSRKKAREAEKDISAKLRIPQAFKQEILLQSLSRPVNRNGIEEKFKGLSASLRESYKLEPEELNWLEEYPIDLPLAHAPQLRETPGSHRGEFVGIKGKWMIYESSGYKALNLSDLPARYLSREKF